MTDALSHASPPNLPSSTAPSIIDKVRLNRVREMARRQGFYVVKRGDRCPWSCCYNTFIVYPLDGGPPVLGVGPSVAAIMRAPIEAFNATLDDVETWLKERAPPKNRPSKALENRIRRMARRVGLRLERTKRRDPRAEDFGAYTLTDTTGPVFGPSDLGGIEQHLLQGSPK